MELVRTPAVPGRKLAPMAWSAPAKKAGRRKLQAAGAPSSACMALSWFFPGSFLVLSPSTRARMGCAGHCGWRQGVPFCRASRGLWLAFGAVFPPPFLVIVLTSTPHHPPSPSPSSSSFIIHHHRHQQLHRVPHGYIFVIMDAKTTELRTSSALLRVPHLSRKLVTRIPPPPPPTCLIAVKTTTVNYEETMPTIPMTVETCGT